VQLQALRLGALRGRSRLGAPAVSSCEDQVALLTLSPTLTLSEPCTTPPWLLGISIVALSDST
jgi:hypothetical protein